MSADRGEYANDEDTLHDRITERVADVSNAEKDVSSCERAVDFTAELESGASYQGLVIS